MEQSNSLSWFKRNWAILSILLFALAIRIYYFVMTYNQSQWFDESVYMLISQRWAFGIDYSFPAVRPILFSLITALFFKISATELLPRLFILILSMFSVFGMYLLGKEMYGKTMGLIASFLMSVFYLGLFFTYRLLVDLPSMTFFIFSALFFYKYCKEKKPKFLYLTAGILAIGTLFKLSTAFILLPFVIFSLVTFKFDILKRKETWLATGLFLLILAPYIIWGYSEFGGFVLTQAAEHVAPENYLSQGWANLKGYLMNFPTYFSWWIIVPFLAGMFFMYLTLKEDKKIRNSRNIYLLMLLILPLILISLTVNHMEDRYIFVIFPIVFLITSYFIEGVYNSAKSLSTKGHAKLVAIAIILLFFGVVAYNQINSADVLIKNKLYSYADVKEAGLWLKENSNSSDIVATKSQPQIRYYSGLKTIGLPPTEQEFEKQLYELQWNGTSWVYRNNIRFYMISIFEVHPDWAYDYPAEKNLTIENAYITADQKATLVIYKLK